MSLAQMNATALLCQLLEMNQSQINGAAMVGPEHDQAGRELLHERLLGIGSSLAYVTCPECGVELARVVRQTGRDQIMLHCDECQEVTAGIALQQTYKVHLSKLIDRLADSLDLPPVSRKVINADKAWRLGVAETTRANAVTWYFARHLHTPVVAKHVFEQVRADHALRSAKILTSSEVPLPEGSPLRDFTVLNLSATARLAHSRFVFFTDRADTPPAATASEPAPTNSLIYLRSLSVAYVEGQSYALEPMQVKILVALLDNHDHRMEPAALREACASDADPFQPVKFFGRRKKVYETFIRYAAGDKEYELILPDEDKSWVC